MADLLFEPGTGPKIAIVVGEASGDQLGAALIEAILVRIPNARIAGIAGPKMISLGARSVGKMETLSVGGLVEVVRHLPSILGLRRRLLNALKAERPDLYIGIDAPDFNLGVERQLKRAGITTMHYVSPSIWAWRPSRIRKIRAAVDHMLLLFPFETPIYQQSGVAATYVGHPLADRFPVRPNQDAQRERLNIRSGRQVLSILPGSRLRELTSLAPLFIATAKLLHARYPDLLLLVPFVSRETRAIFEQEIWRQEAQELPWHLMFGHAHEAMIASDVVLLASGTATLEAMLAKRPMVVAYRMAALTYRLIRRKFLLPYVSLPNIVAGRFLVPEFLQEAATADHLTQALSNYLDDKRLSLALSDEFLHLHETLRCDAASRAADVIYRMLRL